MQKFFENVGLEKFDPIKRCTSIATFKIIDLTEVFIYKTIGTIGRMIVPSYLREDALTPGNVKRTCVTRERFQCNEVSVTWY